MFVQMKPDPEHADVEVDGKTLGKEEAAAVLDHPEDSGVEQIVGEITSDAKQDSVAAALQSKTAETGSEDVHLHHSAAPDQLCSEDRTADGNNPPANHPEVASNALNCPFMNSR